MPAPGDEVKFRNHVHKFRNFWWGVFDFESVQVTPNYECAECLTDSLARRAERAAAAKTCKVHRTRTLAQQLPITVSFILLDWEDRVHYKAVYTGTDCAEQFIRLLLAMEPLLMEVLTRNQHMTETPGSRQLFAQATTCHICDEPFVEGDEKEKKCRDHDHISTYWLVK